MSLNATKRPNPLVRTISRPGRACRLLPALAALACGGGCSALQGLQSPAGAYVAADRATYDAVAPEYADYVAHDAALTDEQRARRDRTVQTWRLRLETAERAGADAKSGRSGEGEKGR